VPAALPYMFCSFFMSTHSRIVLVRGSQICPSAWQRAFSVEINPAQSSSGCGRDFVSPPETLQCAHCESHSKITNADL
jgi:hypothetical protein